MTKSTDMSGLSRRAFLVTGSALTLGALAGPGLRTDP